jgi:hypothetical protein
MLAMLSMIIANTNGAKHMNILIEAFTVLSGPLIGGAIVFAVLMGLTYPRN